MATRRARGNDPEAPAVPSAEKPRGSRRGAAPVNWDDKIVHHIRAKSQDELGDLVWSLAQRFPEIYQELRERIACSKKAMLSDWLWKPATKSGGSPPRRPGRTNGPVKGTYRTTAGSAIASSDSWSSAMPIRSSPWGVSLIQGGMRQVGDSHDEGETAGALTACFPVVFQAVTRSSLSGPERLLFAIDARLADDYDVVGDSCAAVFETHSQPEEWSVVADTLAERLKTVSVGTDRGPGSTTRNYHRDRLTNWINPALREAGREEELQTLFESEARATGSYERLVRFLLEKGRFEDAERWAKEGIAATSPTYPGITTSLAASLCELAQEAQVVGRGRRACRLPVLRPSEPVDVRGTGQGRQRRRGSRSRSEPRHGTFSRRGAMPYQAISPNPVAGTTTRTKSSAKRGVATTRPSASSPRMTAETPAPPVPLKIDPAWPLPVPDYLIPLMNRLGRPGAAPRPHPEVLLEMAIAAKRPDEVLRWFDRMRSDRQGSDYSPGRFGYADRVAAAVLRPTRSARSRSTRTP